MCLFSVEVGDDLLQHDVRGSGLHGTAAHCTILGALTATRAQGMAARDEKHGAGTGGHLENKTSLVSKNLG